MVSERPSMAQHLDCLACRSTALCSHCCTVQTGGLKRGLIRRAPALYQRFLLLPGQLFDSNFTAHCRFLRVKYLVINQLHGAPAAGIFCTFSQIVRRKPLFEIVCPPGIIRMITAFYYISIVVHFPKLFPGSSGPFGPFRSFGHLSVRLCNGMASRSPMAAANHSLYFKAAGPKCISPKTDGAASLSGRPPSVQMIACENPAANSIQYIILPDPPFVQKFFRFYSRYRTGSTGRSFCVIAK